MEQERIKNYEECHLKIGLNTSIPSVPSVLVAVKQDSRCKHKEGGEDASREASPGFARGKLMDHG